MVSKMRRIFSLCFSEMTPETSRNGVRIFERNFVESLQGQRTKFVHFALITFAQYCNHKEICIQINDKQVIKMPEKGSKVKFTNVHNHL